jgi:hypothetical protein
MKFERNNLRLIGKPSVVHTLKNALRESPVGDLETGPDNVTGGVGKV